MKKLHLLKMRVNYGETINLGNYESKRIDLSVEFDTTEEEWEDESAIWLNLLKDKVKNG